MAEKEPAPKRPLVFFSYSWSSDEHKDWVRHLADQLIDKNVDVLLDQYALQPGHDTYDYMEQMAKSDEVAKVYCICDAVYRHKADSRSGGAGTEAQIITPELYGKVKQTKFVALVREKDADGPCVPTFMKGRFFIDFSNDEEFDERVVELLRDVYAKPKAKKPSFGPPPAFLKEDETSAVILATAGMAQKVERALSNGQPGARGLILKYVDAFSEAIPGVCPVSESLQAEDCRDFVVKSIDRLRVYRDDFLKVVDAMAVYGADAKSWAEVRRLFEVSLKWVAPSSDGRFDALRFLRRDMFLSSVAVLLKRGQPDEVVSLLASPYYWGGMTDPVVGYGQFDAVMRSLLDSFQSDPHGLIGDLVAQGLPRQYCNLDYYAQVDLILCLRSLLDARKLNKWRPWHHRIYGDEFELFERAKTQSGYVLILNLMGFGGGKELIAALDEVMPRLANSRFEASIVEDFRRQVVEWMK